ncbi:hypothetical protein GTA08_BOTSDO09866 [Botryosphaeria dothidea]|uniref:Uncharacterized protein n=1 Tax=Botryosphaeria dothidea TaxID=55169 RepID=A0A8H4MWY1_9PEZI|nr:hypothetical protein GTA08_BOTSDO09866 [Botryosphaeria dothidea]
MAANTPKVMDMANLEDTKRHGNVDPQNHSSETDDQSSTSAAPSRPVSKGPPNEWPQSNFVQKPTTTNSPTDVSRQPFPRSIRSASSPENDNAADPPPRSRSPPSLRLPPPLSPLLPPNHPFLSHNPSPFFVDPTVILEGLHAKGLDLTASEEAQAREEIVLTFRIANALGGNMLVAKGVDIAAVAAKVAEKTINEKREENVLNEQKRRLRDLVNGKTESSASSFKGEKNRVVEPPQEESAE